MLSYNLAQEKGPLYKTLYKFIREDIQNGKLKANEKMPSKRALAKNLGISTISIENAYEQLISEGYLYSVPKSGYFVCKIENIRKLSLPKANEKNHAAQENNQEKSENLFDFSSNQIEKSNFPFSVWAKLLRETISTRENNLLEVSPCGGVKELQAAIANHLESFRGMSVNPHQIIVGAGTEYLYGLLIKLLGSEKTYCIENPGYRKLQQIYESNNVKCIPVDMDEKGLSVKELRKSSAQIAHISPTHHFPTGIFMPVSRRYEILTWASEDENHYVIEDDYDSEFRLKGKPAPSLYSMDVFGKIIYLNTFSKSLTSTIRISYMILPEKLAELFYKKLSFYSCTVSTFEQYTLSSFISQGYFEKHINRMRLHYGKRRNQVMEIIRTRFKEDQCKIIENESGLHFILQFNTKLSDQQVKKRLREKGIIISSITDFYMTPCRQNLHQFILNYSNINVRELDSALEKIKTILF